ncbi:phospho-N-acetylmuramoyl-pentapeptide-transferase [Microlunatus speluncae]|uniref:phospho-N-acetylmuramoyl-pentapeptide- transferase n=1 Tax=Microlunatus speluncae TaxID=2594267 RepID=UPI001266452F|nr:phospho-N-acetylmuramoyl-pentapeptide-transferase [Microlunatus speluncae]
MIALFAAGAASLIFTFALTPVAVKLFRRLGWGQMIRADGPQTHQVKAGTPTKGGIVFVTGAIFGYLVAHLIIPATPITASGLLAIGLMTGLGLVGFLDDFTKTRRRRSLGLTGRQKIAGQVIVATAFAVLALLLRDPVTGVAPASPAISWVRDLPFLNLAALGAAGLVLYVVWINLLAVATSNAVNLTDGADGLAAGATIIALSAYTFIALFQSRMACQSLPVGDPTYDRCFVVRDPLDLAIFAVALAASLVGYLWYSGPPGQIFMGDVGSLGLGGAVAALAIFTRTELLLIIIGGLYVSVAGSVIIQTTYFKLTRGRRIFLMSPLHHHFEMKGWPEIQITMRFWIIAVVCAIAGASIFYVSWLTG